MILMTLRDFRFSTRTIDKGVSTNNAVNPDFVLFVNPDFGTFEIVGKTLL